jgi:hypothetical protein
MQAAFLLNKSLTDVVFKHIYTTQALEKYAKLVTTSTTETKDNVPTSLGFRF